MTEQTKATAGAKGKTQDYISQLKKEAEGAKDTKSNQNDEIDWERNESEEEEETTPQQKKKGVVVQQGAVGSDKPKKLRDLFDDAPKQQKPKTAASKPQEGKKTIVGAQKGGEVYKPRFTNSKGVQNKEGTYTPSVASTSSVHTKPKFEKKFDEKKKFVNTGALLNAAEENAKVKGPAKDYLEADAQVKYKENEPVEIEKPKFVNKNVENSNEPHLKELNVQEDLFYKKLNEGQVEIQNVYSQPRTEKENKEKPQGKKQYKEREPREPREPREFRERKHEKEDEKELDSDGFEIVTTTKTKPDDYKPKRKHFNNNDKHFNKDRKPYKGKNEKREKREKSAEKETEDKVNEETTTNVDESSKAPVKKADKQIVKIDPTVKKLKDLF